MTKTKKDIMEMKRADLYTDLILKHAGDAGEEIAQASEPIKTRQQSNHFIHLIIRNAAKKMNTKEFADFATKVLNDTVHDDLDTEAASELLIKDKTLNFKKPVKKAIKKFMDRYTNAMVPARKKTTTR